MQFVKKIAFLLVAFVWIQSLSLCSDNKFDKKYDISQDNHEYGTRQFVGEAIAQDRKYREIEVSVLNHLKEHRPNNIYKNIDAALFIGFMLKSNVKVAKGFTVLGISLKDFFVEQLAPDALNNQHSLSTIAGVNKLIKLADNRINEKLHSQEITYHVRDVLTRVIMENLDIATINDPVLNYIQLHEPWYNRNIVSVVRLASILKSDEMIMDRFDATREGFKSYLKQALVPSFLGDGDLLIEEKNYINRVTQIKEYIAEEHLDERVKLGVYNYLSDVIERDGDVELTGNSALNYVRKYQHEKVLKNVLREYLLYRPTGVEDQKTIVEKILAMPVTPAKFELITSLLIDTDLIKAEPVLRIAEDLETLRFLIDDGAMDIE